MSDAAPGWYTDPYDPTMLRWWDGEWTNATRPAEPAPAPEPVVPTPAYVPPPSPQVTAPPQPMYVPVPAPPKQKSGCLGVGLGLMLALLVGLVLLVGGCVVVVSRAADDVTDKVDELEALAESGDIGSTDSSNEGTLDSPYFFGESHSRSPGFFGAAWTLSIDEVRPIPKSPAADSADPRVCAAIIVTATLDSLDTGELTADLLSLPELAVVDATGETAETDAFQCDGSGLIAEGITAKYEFSLTEGGTGRFYEAILMDSLDFEYAAVESTIYMEP